MAENMIKDFVKKQTTSLNIGTPKQKPVVVPEVSPVNRVEDPKEKAAGLQKQIESSPVVKNTLVEEKPLQTVKAKVGRPKGDVEKVKLSVYVPAEVKAKLIKLQHMTYKQSINDVMIEGIYMLLTKYEL